MAEYDILYLQRQEHIAGLPIVQPWRVNDDDVEYIPSTSRRLAADAMYEALETIMANSEQHWAWAKVCDAITLADGDKEVE